MAPVLPELLSFFILRINRLIDMHEASIDHHGGNDGILPGFSEIGAVDLAGNQYANISLVGPVRGWMGALQSFPNS